MGSYATVVGTLCAAFVLGFFCLTYGAFDEDHQSYKAITAAKASGLSHCPHSEGVAEDIEGQTRVLYVCSDRSRFGYVGYSYHGDYWPFWD